MNYKDALLVIFLVLAILSPDATVSSHAASAKKPHSTATATAGEKTTGAREDHEAGGTIKTHQQKSTQRKPSEKVRTETHDSKIRLDLPDDVFESPEAKAADHIPEPLPSDEVRTKPTSPDEPRKKSKMERAWGFYNQKRYAVAADLFEEIVRSEPNQALNARLGLAYSRLNQEKRTAAIAHLEYLVERKYKLKETLPLLLNLTFEDGKYYTTQRYVHLLPLSEKNRWRRRIQKSQLNAHYSRLKQSSDPVPKRDWALLLDRHSRALDHCIRPDIFFEAATHLKDAPYSERSVAVHQSLLACELPSDLRLGVVDQLSGLLDPDAAVAMLKKEKAVFEQIKPRYLSKIDKLTLQALKRRLADLGEGSDAQRSTAEAILRLEPSDQDARAALAWSDLEQKKYRQSESHFNKLWLSSPQNRDYALGLGYSRFNLGRYADALEPLERGGIADDSRTLELKALVYKARARQAYERQDWLVAGKNLEAAIKIDPQDTDSRSLLAWTYFQQGRREEALGLMEGVYAKEKSAASAGALMDLYESGSNPERSWHLADEMAGSSDSGSRQRAADFYFSKRAPVSAAQISSDDQACYTGAAAPRGEAFVYHRNKSGDNGTSRLAETALPISFTYPTHRGNQWSLSVTPRYLSSGDAPDRPFAGRFYRFLNGTPQTRSLEDSLWVWQPDISFEREGRYGISAHLGTSPIGGPVDPTPTLGVSLSTKNWFLNLHRCTVKDSILAYTGLRDPYGSREWGRVLRNGVSAGATWKVFDDYWFNASASYDVYTGERLWDNSSVQINTAAGRTFDRNGDELTLGLFLTAQHYRRNSDFYTYGHGGYYSPELMTLAGPFVRYRSALCRTYWFDVQVSAGWLHQELDGSPVYPLFNGNVAGFTPAAAADALSQYEGESDDKLGLSVKIQGMKLITDRLAIGGFAGIDNNADFTSWQVGAGLQFFFEPQKAFWQRRDFFKDFGDCSNR